VGWKRICNFNNLSEYNRRLVVRGDIKQWNQMLAETAHDAGEECDGHKEDYIFEGEAVEIVLEGEILS
jgi:hypothetical protein